MGMDKEMLDVHLMIQKIDRKRGMIYEVDENKHVIGGRRIPLDKGAFIEQLQLIGSLTGKDWSGTVFDGGDVKKWIEDTISGEDIRAKLNSVYRGKEK